MSFHTRRLAEKASTCEVLTKREDKFDLITSKNDIHKLESGTCQILEQRRDASDAPPKKGITINSC